MSKSHFIAVKPRAQARMEAIDEGSSNKSEDKDHVTTSNSSIKMGSVRPTQLDVLDRIKINNTKETPRSTIKGVLYSSEKDEIIFNRNNLKEVENKLKFAFIEFYQKLRLLKSFRSFTSCSDSRGYVPSLIFSLSFMHRRSLVAVVASLEIIRRGKWNFFRLENEHLNNVGKYRAFKTVPLPFNYDKDDDKGN
ncbi:unnamed protein product [Cochlearia groenlandica]